MVRLSDLPEIDAESLRGIPCEAFATTPWVGGRRWRNAASPW